MPGKKDNEGEGRYCKTRRQAVKVRRAMTKQVNSQHLALLGGLERGNGKVTWTCVVPLSLFLSPLPRHSESGLISVGEKGKRKARWTCFVSFSLCSFFIAPESPVDKNLESRKES